MRKRVWQDRFEYQNRILLRVIIFVTVLSVLLVDQSQLAAQPTDTSPATTNPSSASDADLVTFQNEALSLNYPKSWTKLPFSPSPTVRFMVYPGTNKNAPGNIAE